MKRMAFHDEINKILFIYFSPKYIYIYTNNYKKGVVNLKYASLE